MAVPQSMSYANIAGLQFVYGPRSSRHASLENARAFIRMHLALVCRQRGPPMRSTGSSSAH